MTEKEQTVSTVVYYKDDYCTDSSDVPNECLVKGHMLSDDNLTFSRVMYQLTVHVRLLSCCIYMVKTFIKTRKMALELLSFKCC